MNISEITFLPGLNKQLKFLQSKVGAKDKSVLIIGNNTERIARKFKKDAKDVIIIVEDQEDLAGMRFNLKDSPDISVRYMEYSNTDFFNRKFDIIYAQGSLTRSDRNKILKEIKKILQPGGVFCVGEIVSLTEDTPQFVQDVWDNSDLSPLNINKINNFYEEKGYKVIESVDLSASLEEFYLLSQEFLKESFSELSKDEIKSYKKLLNQMKHDTNVYLKLGGDKHIGFKTFLLRVDDK